jgi:hypothetical protein
MPMDAVLLPGSRPFIRSARGLSRHASRITSRNFRAFDAEAITSPKGTASKPYAASFYESVALREAAAKCVDGQRNLAVLDSEINAFNDLLAKKCGG